MQQNLTKPIRPAATVLIIRDRQDGVEVITLQRSPSMRFLPGFLSFPGGSLQDDDWLCARERTNGSIIASGQDDDLAYAVAAIREAGEEVGVLPALVGQTGSPADNRISLPLQAALLANEKSLLQILKEEGMWLDVSQLRFVGRWVTPAHMPARFDTRFFLVDGSATHGTLSVHESENVWAKWCRPGDLLAAIREGREKAVPPTIAMLEALATAPSTSWCLDRLNVPGPILQPAQHQQG
jgi:8-oxo-dGTP pyrophosphatase MutT (NUDIX family)